MDYEVGICCEHVIEATLTAFQFGTTRFVVALRQESFGAPSCAVPKLIVKAEH
jgi:hypothetical protein